ncbi:MAG TPA: 3-isopropylmalate dehydratase large subunit [Acidobacteriota bacterium]|nr:3-isopropylmalate dehydratase large subunit [Acidobacteriota bacterium]
MSVPRTLYRKIWDAHVVVQPPEAPAILYIDRHYVHEVTSPQAFAGLRRRGLGMRRPDRTVATADHSVPTGPLDGPTDPQAAAQVAALETNCRRHGITCFGPGHPRQGIVHVIGPELGLTLPGMTVVCGDSHTATHGAFGALAFGIGTSEVEQVLATQCLLQRPSKTCRVMIAGRRRCGVTAKDLVLALVAALGTGGGTGYVLEYAGAAVRALSMEERMTVCNMSIEAGARAGLVAPDDSTFQYLCGRPHAPQGKAWEAAVAAWRRLPSDPEAVYDRTVSLDADVVEPMITFGTTPAMGMPITGTIPDPDGVSDADIRRSLKKALDYMGLPAGRPLLGHPVDAVFIGSCTNGRFEDLAAAAAVFRGRRVASGVRALVVPGSRAVKRAAEAAGLDRVFRAAGAEWREPGCSMCLAMNGDRVPPGAWCVSTSNRNFEGRQGSGSRTLLAGPPAAAAAAVTGVVTDPRIFLEA